MSGPEQGPGNGQPVYPMVAIAADLVDRGMVDDAIAAYRVLEVMLPRWSMPVVARGILQQGQGKLDAAERAYRDAIARDPENPEAHLHLGQLMLERGEDPEGAARHLERASELDQQGNAGKRALQLLGRSPGR